MSFLPGWDSVQSTETIAHQLHIAAVIVLGLLFIAEGMALVYDYRNRDLARVASDAAESQRKREADAAEARRRTEVARLQSELGEANKRVRGLESQTVARRLTGDQTAELVRALVPFRGQKVFIWCSTSAWDATPFATDFLEAFKQAGWEPTDQIRYGIVVGGDSVGIEVLINPQMVDGGGRVSMPSVVMFVQTLVRIGLMPQPADGRMSEVEPGTIYLRIGRIPPPRR